MLGLLCNRYVFFFIPCGSTNNPDKTVLLFNCNKQTLRVYYASPSQSAFKQFLRLLSNKWFSYFAVLNIFGYSAICYMYLAIALLASAISYQFFITSSSISRSPWTAHSYIREDSYQPLHFVETNTNWKYMGGHDFWLLSWDENTIPTQKENTPATLYVQSEGKEQFKQI